MLMMMVVVEVVEAKALDATRETRQTFGAEIRDPDRSPRPSFDAIRLADNGDVYNCRVESTAQ